MQMISDNKIVSALYVVATPIGNLGDITLRAIEVLKSADFVICEDTRVTAKLIRFYEIDDKKLLIYNDNSDEKMRDRISHLLMQGKILALVSDAGTPLISDPGHKLINSLRSKNHKIIPIPGASSLTATICASGLACDNFLFLGFLPTSKIQKTKLLKSLPRNFTFVFFESANRVSETLSLINEISGNRNACAAREITKIYEEIITDKLENLIEFFTNQPEKLRGEFVIVIEKSDRNEKSLSREELSEAISEALAANHSLKDLSQNLAEIYSLNKKEIYQLALEISKTK